MAVSWARYGLPSTSACLLACLVPRWRASVRPWTALAERGAGRGHRPNAVRSKTCKQQHIPSKP
eukprot:12986379-Alexandrium_andersonii.AAC.1